MPLIVLDLTSPERGLVGYCQRYLLEIRPGLFVGNLSKREAMAFWETLERFEAKSALLVYPAKNELGLAFQMRGHDRRAAIDHFGLPLILRADSAAIANEEFISNKSID